MEDNLAIDVHRTNRLADAIADAKVEAIRVSRFNPPYNSAYEAWAVLRKEVDDLWDEVKRNEASRSRSRMRKEALQVAAVAMRFAAEVCDEPAPAAVLEAQR